MIFFKVSWLPRPDHSLPLPSYFSYSEVNSHARDMLTAFLSPLISSFDFMFRFESFSDLQRFYCLG